MSLYRLATFKGWKVKGQGHGRENSEIVFGLTPQIVWFSCSKDQSLQIPGRVCLLCLTLKICRFYCCCWWSTLMDTHFLPATVFLTDLLYTYTLWLTEVSMPWGLVPKKLECCAHVYPTLKMFDDMFTFSRFNPIPAYDGDTDRQTSCHNT